MELNERIQKWVDAGRINTSQVDLEKVKRFETEHLVYPHGHYLLTLNYLPCGLGREVAKLQLTCTANDVSDRTWVEHQGNNLAKPIIAAATVQVIPLTERLWRLAVAENVTPPNINWNYARDFRNAHIDDGGYSFIARFTQKGELLGMKLACVPSELNVEVVQKHKACRTPADLPYAMVYNGIRIGALAIQPDYNKAA